MFENVFAQNAVRVLESDMRNGRLPTALLLSGPKYSGKLTAALELARVLSCEGGGERGCGCKSCTAHRMLLSPSMILAGRRRCLPEIKAAGARLLREPESLDAAALFVRATRKLLVRFNPLVWEGSSKSGEINKSLEKIGDALEKFEGGGKIDAADAAKAADAVAKSAAELDGFLSDTIPIAQIRKIREWSMQTGAGKRKTVIFESADLMNDSARNALLKVLEEANESTVFALLTENKARMMPTILSRVRNYPFERRSAETERKIVEDVFKAGAATLAEFFAGFSSLPVEKIKEAAEKIVDFAFRDGRRPSEGEIVEALGKDDKKGAAAMLFRETLETCRKLDWRSLGENGRARFFKIAAMLSDANAKITAFNCSCESVLELLFEKLSQG